MKKEDKKLIDSRLVYAKHQKALRIRFRKAIDELNTIVEKNNAIFKRQVEEVDLFDSDIYTQNELLYPPYAFSSLKRIYEESDVLQECVDTMVQNVDGFGYQLNFLGNDITDREKKDSIEQYNKAKNFFDYANEDQSWKKIRKLFRKDYEMLGNAGFECIRNRRGELAVVYHIPFNTIRLRKIDTDPVVISMKIPRNGKIITIPIKKYFRRFAQIKCSGEKVRWFKSFGDPRVMDALTGEYITDISGKMLQGKKKPKIIASELLFFKNEIAGQSYGIPRWIGGILDIMGRRSAQYVNYDLFENQGIPPMAVMVSGGVLTDESIEALEDLVRSARGVENFNKVLLLESNPESLGLEDKGSAKIELKNLTEYRKDDQMFGRYLIATEKAIRHIYRLPPLFTGSTETYSYATTKSARLVAEEQIFIPEREDFDEVIDINITKRELNIDLWEYKTKGPRIVGTDEMTKGIDAFGKVGAFTINHAIDMANNAFGLQMTKFDEPWANYPLNLVTKLLEVGRLTTISELEVATPVIENNLEKMEETNTKVLESDLFSEEEKALYKQLMTIQHAILSKE